MPQRFQHQRLAEPIFIATTAPPVVTINNWLGDDEMPFRAWHTAARDWRIYPHFFFAPNPIPNAVENVNMDKWFQNTVSPMRLRASIQASQMQCFAWNTTTPAGGGSSSSHGLLGLLGVG